jgi:Heparinase II/III-like protein/Alginate lyase
MSLFLSAPQLDARRELLRDPAALGGLAASLQRELHGALDVPVPAGKSRLTRHGGRCATCTVLLTFDPRSPDAHTCPTCGAVSTDAVHHEWWLMNGHLWTAEQSTRAAALALLVDDAVAARRADDILDAYTERYAGWPNCDNALGPTRPFFSTYLESIWLLHLATALDLRIAASGTVSPRQQDTLRRLIEPSARLIAGFDEGRSNRQVWHCAALFAASALLGDHDLRNRAARSLRYLLETGLHTDGSWYEGENYHLFAHRGLLSAVTLAERAGVDLPAPLMARFEAGFAVPFRTMLPDGTFPSRRDSQYGITLRQYRTADWLECGIARTDTPELRSALATLYATWPDIGDTGRSASTGDAERNQRSVRLTRADCNWRALLLARPELPPLADATPHSELLEGQGLAIFRRDAGKLWVGLDYGDPGDGHGHPDRLNLVVAMEHVRCLDDVGTGSYTSPTLAWYRSSMAHNAPMVNGRDQGAAHGTLLAHDEQGDAGWVSAAFVDPVSQVRFVRTVVVLADHLVDEVTWCAPTPVTVDVPMHVLLLNGGRDAWQPFVPGTAMDAWLTDPVCDSLDADTARGVVVAHRWSPLVAPGTDHVVGAAWSLWTDSPATLWAAGSIGPPAGTPHGVLSLRQYGTSGRSIRMTTYHALATSFDVDGDSVTVGTRADAAHRWRHRRLAHGWEIAGPEEASQVITLAGHRSSTPSSMTGRGAPSDSEPEATRLAWPSYAVTPLGEAHYRPTEESWDEAGRPQAEIRILSALSDLGSLVVTAAVTLSRPPFFAPACEENPLDNELADVNSDGVQLHWRSPSTGSWNSVIAVPDGGAVRLSVAEGALEGVTATWSRTEAGYDLSFVLPWPETWPDLRLDVIVNERPPERERRRGQLVLSGARGEFAYLRGARQSPARAVWFVFHPAQP